MHQRILGEDLKVSAIGLGCMNMSNDFANPDTRKEMIGIIRRAYELGVTYFDTAEVYGSFNNETLVGEALKPLRDKVVIETKCGIKVADGKRVVDGRVEEIRKSIDGSLKRLQTDCIDLYFLHRVDLNVPIEEIAEVMMD